MTDRFERQLDAVLADLGLPPVQAHGSGGLPSRYAVSDLAVQSVGRAGAWLARYRDAEAVSETCVRVDRALASRWFASSLRPLGWQVPGLWDAIAGDYPCTDGWIRLHTNAPVHRLAALRALALPSDSDRSSVADAVARCRAEALEVAVVASGGCAAELRSPAQWAAHPQGRAVASQPLVLHQQSDCGVADLSPLERARPLSQIKVLDLTRVLAGPVAGRFLAAYGARVLRIDPPEWGEPGVVPEVTLGKRCAGLDLRRNADRQRFAELIGQCDVLLHGYRPGALAALGFDRRWRLANNPRLIDVSLSAYGWEGPWAGRRGFDSLVQMSTGIASPMQPEGLPSPLPVQALDHATGYLMAAAVLRGLTLRREQGVAVCSRLSLAGTAALLLSEGEVSGTESMPEETAADIDHVLEQTDWGPANRLKFPLQLDGVEPHWDLPAGELRRHAASWS